MPSDTTPDARERMAAALRAKSPAQRLAMLDAMWRSAAEMIACRLAAVHPDWDEQRIARETARRLSHGAV